MQILRAVLAVTCAFGAQPVSANDDFRVSMAPHVNTMASALRPERARIGVQYEPNDRITIQFNFNAFSGTVSNHGTGPRTRARAQAGSLTSPLRIGNATVSVTTSMELRFGLKF